MPIVGLEPGSRFWEGDAAAALRHLNPHTAAPGGGLRSSVSTCFKKRSGPDELGGHAGALRGRARPGRQEGPGRDQSGFPAQGIRGDPTPRRLDPGGTSSGAAPTAQGAFEPRDHINDVLIVLDASRLGVDLVTENSSDMKRWRRMLPRGRRAFRVERVERSEHRMA